jgi:glycosyltransferase involved in cell wall biosynthesis
MANLLFITRSFGGGGAEGVVNTLMNESLERSDLKIHRLVLVSCSSLNDKNNTHLNSTSALRYTLQIYKFFKENKIDIVISNLTYVNIIMILMNFLIRKRLFCVEHNIIYSKQYQHYTQPIYIRLMAKFLYKFASGIVCVSQGVASDVSAFYKVKQENIRVINNPISVKHCCIDKKYNKTSPLIYLGAHSFQKGIEDLLYAYEEYYLESECPRSLIIYGAHNSNTSTYKSIISNLSSCKNITFGGFIEPSKAISSAHCVIIPSRWEGFCNVVVESIVIGAHVITTTCHYGPSEIVRNLGEGELYDPGDIQTLTEKMIKIDELPYLKKTYGYNDYLPSSVYKKYISLVSKDV